MVTTLSNSPLTRKDEVTKAIYRIRFEGGEMIAEQVFYEESGSYDPNEFSELYKTEKPEFDRETLELLSRVFPEYELQLIGKFS